MPKKINIKNLTSLAIIVSGLIIVGAVIYIKPFCPAGKEEAFLTSEQAGEKAVKYINDNFLQGAAVASLVSTSEENGVYKFKFKIEQNEYDSYVTRDGKFLFVEAIDLEAGPESGQETVEAAPRDTPDVKLFVMSYCPYGLQMQKAFLPVYDLLKDKAEMGVYFVNYIMHEKIEIDENLRQYCLQKNEKEKYDDYLKCFVKEGNAEGCLSQVSVNREMLSGCISQTDQEYQIYSQYQDENTWLGGSFPRFDVHKDLNERYGISGSPTLVINDQIVNVSARSPEKIKEVICQAFNNPPQECSQILSDIASSPGFGESSSNSGNGGCAQ